MRVFSVEMLVKEEGAATVQAALNRLKKETQAVAADMKVTAQAVTGTGKAMQGAANQTQIAGDRAAKAAIGFAAVGQSIARTGSLTADAGTRIIEAGSQISMMFGPSGLAVAALLGFAAAAVTSFSKAKDEAKKMAEETQKALREMVLAGDVSQITKRLRDIQDGLLDLTSGEFTGGLDDLRKQYDQVRQSIANTTAAQEGRRLTAQEMSANKQRIADLRALERQIRSLEAQERSLLRARELAGRFVAAPTGGGGGGGGGGRPLAGLPGVGGAISGVGRPAFDIAAIQAAIPQATGIVLSEADKAAVEMSNQLRQTFQESVGAALVGGIVGGIEQAVASGNIGEGFKAMSSMMLAGLGDAMIQFGMQSATFSGLMETIMGGLAFMNPATSLTAALTLIAAGAALKGVARGMFGGQKGGRAGSMSSFGGGGGGFGANLPITQIIFGQTSATTAAGMTPRSSTNITVIGPNDPSAQRAIQEIMTKANSRGRIG